VAVKKTLLESKRLPYPKASTRAGLAPMQRHIPWSIATARFRLGRVIARSLPLCPCCAKAYPQKVQKLRLDVQIEPRQNRSFAQFNH
jgi:uncharacterized protein